MFNFRGDQSPWTTGPGSASVYESLVSDITKTAKICVGQKDSSNSYKNNCASNFHKF